jgi:DNA-directed RNA polymerase specialized sigma24 family protein
VGRDRRRARCAQSVVLELRHRRERVGPVPRPTRAEIGNLGPLLERLDSRERMIVRGRFGLDGQQRTLRQLARSLGVSAERVRQLQQRALDKMREATLEQC